MVKVYFDGETSYGSFIYGASVILPEDYTMNQLVTAIKDSGYRTFKLGTCEDLPRYLKACLTC